MMKTNPPQGPPWGQAHTVGADLCWKWRRFECVLVRSQNIGADRVCLSDLKMLAQIWCACQNSKFLAQIWCAFQISIFGAFLVCLSIFRWALRAQIALERCSQTLGNPQDLRKFSGASRRREKPLDPQTLGTIRPLGSPDPCDPRDPQTLGTLICRYQEIGADLSVCLPISKLKLAQIVCACPQGGPCGGLVFLCFHCRYVCSEVLGGFEQLVKKYKNIIELKRSLIWTN